MSEIIAESSIVYCDCPGAMDGEVEKLCEKCLDAYADAVIQGVTGPQLIQELSKLAMILAKRFKDEPALADAVKADFEAKAVLSGEMDYDSYGG